MSGEHSDGFRAQVRPEAGEHHHAAIRCRDMKLLMNFYERVMGLPRRNIAGDPDNPEKVWYPGLQLVHTDDPPGPQGELDHIGISVNNIREICAHVEASGFTVDKPVESTDDPEKGQRFSGAWLTDPEGHTVELVQRERLPE